MEEEPIRVMQALPPRVKGKYLERRQKCTVDTNLYKVNYNPNVTIAIYSAKFNPRIQYDNRSLRNTLLNKAMREVKLGDFVINGATVFACQKEGGPNEKTFNANVTDGGTNYEITFERVRQIDLKEIDNPDKRKQGVVYTFLNNLVKTFLTKLGYMEIGKSRKYYSHKMSQYLPGANVTLYQGFGTSFASLESGIYLKIDSCTRVVQRTSCMDRVDTLYNIHKNLDKDEKRNKIKGQFIGQTVMANYGNHRYWKIEDLIFDINTDQYIVNKETNENLTQYYQERYKLNITKKRAPLFKASLNQVKVKHGESEPKKEEKQILLVPEFCLLSGLPDDFDDRKRREVSQKTIINADVKRSRIDNVIAQMNNQLPDFGPKSISKTLGLTIEPTSQQVEAINLGEPTLALGGNNTVERGKTAQFQLFNKPLYETSTPLRIMTFCSQGVNMKPVEDILYSTAKNFRIDCQMQIQRVDFKDRKWSTDLDYFLEDVDNKYKSHNIYWFIIPTGAKEVQYQLIKRTAMKGKNPKLTQVTVQLTLTKKGFNSIITKLLIQMACKVGNQAWLPLPPKQAGNKTLMIGIDTAADKVQKGTICAYCANVKGDFSQFMSSFTLQEGGKEMPDKTGWVLTNAILEYYKTSKSYPKEILVLRNGCADSQISTALEQEVFECREAIDRMMKKQPDFRPALSYIIVDKNVKQKMFKNAGGKVFNADFGTLVNNNITAKENYDFYLVSQKCGAGSVKPAYYKVIHSDSKVQEGILQELIYTQCFNYMNWSGSVTVPACLQYAKKLSGLISGYVNIKDAKYFPDRLYYI